MRVSLPGSGVSQTWPSSSAMDSLQKFSLSKLMFWRASALLIFYNCERMILKSNCLWRCFSVFVRTAFNGCEPEVPLEYCESSDSSFLIE